MSHESFDAIVTAAPQLPCSDPAETKPAQTSPSAALRRSVPPAATVPCTATTVAGALS